MQQLGFLELAIIFPVFICFITFFSPLFFSLFSANDSRCFFVSDSTIFDAKWNVKWWNYLRSLFSHGQDTLQFDCSYAYRTWSLSLNLSFNESRCKKRPRMLAPAIFTTFLSATQCKYGACYVYTFRV
jgi:hypothetical protein